MIDFDEFDIEETERKKNIVLDEGRYCFRAGIKSDVDYYKVIDHISNNVIPIYNNYIRSNSGYYYILVDVMTNEYVDFGWLFYDEDAERYIYENGYKYIGDLDDIDSIKFKMDL